MAALPKTRDDLKAALPDTTKTLHLPDLDAAVEIFRDGYGIPHVRAQSPHDAFFGQGFATAQDRLWHMDHDRRWAYGRWAEYVGQGALEQDLMMRRFQLRASVESDYRAVNSETRDMLDAYTAGVNALIENTESLPIEYGLVEAQPERWAPWDCLAVFKARHILMGVFEAKLWRTRLVSELGPQKAAQILPGYQQGDLLIVPPGAEYDGDGTDVLAQISAGAEAAGRVEHGDAGSNSWAVSGSRTASGKPLLAGDPHRALDTPNVYYQNHVSCPDFDVVGLSFPGCPGFPHFGHNAHVAWCVTHAGADYQDLYVERFKDDSASVYDFKGEWKQAEVRHEVIEVRGAPSVELGVTVTQHGPVIVGDPASGHAVAFKYTATAGPNLGLQPLRRMLEATSADELEESMRDWTDPCNNFLFIDVHGDIGYLNRGKLPIRSIANAWLPVPGWTGEHEWRGLVPFEELARSRNPENGYIVTANNRIVGDDYPHYIGLYFGPAYRARRIYERLKGLDLATVEDMAAIHAEKVSIPGRIYARLLSRVEPLDELSTRAKQYLAGWDGTMDKDSVAPTLYSAFRIQLDRLLLGHLLGPLADQVFRPDSLGAPAHLSQLRSLFATMAGKNDTTLLPPGRDWGSLMAQALAEGVAFLRNRLGDAMDSWTWGKVHFTRPKHTLSAFFPEVAPLLDPPSLPMGGDGDTPQSGGYSPNAPFTMTGSSVARYVFDASDWNNSAWIVPLGASGHPVSPHYADQAPTWGEVQLIPMLYDWDRIEAGADSRQELKPGK
jgi:penicillin amidase